MSYNSAPSTAEELLADVRSRMSANGRQRAELGPGLRGLEEREAADSLTPQGVASLAQARALKKRLDAEAEQLRAELRDAERDVELAKLSREVHPTGQRAPEPSAGFEARAYTRSNDVYTAERDASGERSYFKDMFDSQIRGDVNAIQRMQAFVDEQRAIGTSGFAGLIVPQYLVDQAALVARASRPFANSVQRLEIPTEGMTFQIPKGTTGAATAVQATENSNVQNTDEAWTNITLNVATIAGQQDVSRQSLERGTPGLDGLIMSDLAGAYAANLEQQVLSGSGSSGQIAGVLGTAGVNQATAFTAAATVATFQTKVAGQISAITSTRFLPPSHIAMHPRRWAWLLGQSDSSGRPLVTPVPNGPNNAVAVGDGTATGDTGFTFMGLRVVVSASLPTSVGTGPEDQIIVYRAADLVLFEKGNGDPDGLRFEQTLAGQLTVKLVSYGYAAFTAARYPTAVGIVGGNATLGNGLVAPTF